MDTFTQTAEKKSVWGIRKNHQIFLGRCNCDEALLQGNFRGQNRRSRSREASDGDGPSLPATSITFTPPMQQWIDREVKSRLTEPLGQHVSGRPRPRTAFHQSGQRFMASLPGRHRNPCCVLNQRWTGQEPTEGRWRLHSHFSCNICKVNLCHREALG